MGLKRRNIARRHGQRRKSARHPIWVKFPSAVGRASHGRLAVSKATRVQRSQIRRRFYETCPSTRQPQRPFEEIGRLGIRPLSQSKPGPNAPQAVVTVSPKMTGELRCSGGVMSFQTLSAWLRRQTQSFGAAEGGNLLITFALATVPIVGFVGAAIDYSRANSVKAAMQAASELDRADAIEGRAKSHDPPRSVRRRAIISTPCSTRAEAVNVAVTPTFTSPQQGNFKLDITVTGAVPTTFTKVLRSADAQRRRQFSSALGYPEARSRACARQYRVDVVEQQDDELEDRRAQSAGHAEDRRQDRWRHQGRDCSLRYDRQSRHQLQGQRWFEYDSLKCGNNSCTSSNWKNYWEGCVRDRDLSV